MEKAFVGFVKGMLKEEKESVGFVVYIKRFLLRKEKTNFICRECHQPKTKHQMSNIWICSKCWNRSIRERKKYVELDKDEFK